MYVGVFWETKRYIPCSQLKEKDIFFAGKDREIEFRNFEVSVFHLIGIVSLKEVSLGQVELC